MHRRHAAQAEAHAPAAVDRRPWGVLVLLSVAQFMVILDISVVNVALPSIGKGLHFAPGDLQWVVTAYVLFTGGLLLLGGRATDLFDRRRVFLAGLSIFTLASLTSGLSASPAMLVASRAAQGLGAAMLTPSALSIITTTYVGSQRAAALAVWGAIGGAGAAAGVVLGGVLTSWLGWRSVFFINVPVGVITAALALRLVPRARALAGGIRQLDLPGALTAVGGLMSLVYALEGTGTHSWGSARTLIPLAVAATLLTAFVAIERHVSRPLVPPSIVRVRSLVSGVGLMAGATGILVGTFFLNSLYMQRELGSSALETGLAFLPLTVAIGVAAHLATRVMTRLGTRPLAVAGLGLIAAGALLLSGVPDHASYAANLLPGFMVLALGIGLVFPAATVTTMSDVDGPRAGLASGLMMTGHELGAVLGVATFSAVATAGSTFAAGYAHGFQLAAGVAAVLAVASLLAVPAVRPSGELPVSVH